MARWRDVAVEAILRSAKDKGEAQRALLALDCALERPVGTNQHGEGFDNVQARNAPTGNSEQAGLSRLRKAADKGNEAARGSARSTATARAARSRTPRADGKLVADKG